MAAGKAKANLDKLIAHLGIEIADQQGWNGGDVLGDQPVPETMATFDQSLPDQGVEMGSPQLNWELSDLDLEAIAQGFRLDGELHYLMHPVGIP
jgi:hypothetical protein